MRRLIVALALVLPATAQAAEPAYKDTSLPPAARAADLVARMTFAEKAGQLSTTNAPAIARLQINEYAYWSEAQHGLSAFYGGYDDDLQKLTKPRATSFPTNLAASMTFNPRLMRRESAAISDEARGALDKTLFGNGQNNIGRTPAGYGNLFYWAPTVNIARDPRWGRTDEAFGEDPFLVGTMGSAWVKGFQGRGHYLKAVATQKHFALNNNEKDRMASSSDTDETTIREYYTPQFRRLVQDAHVAGLMSSYNSVNGTPAATDNLLMNVLLRKTWGFDGYTTSDCSAIGAIYRNPDVDRSAVTLVNNALNISGHDWAPPGFTSDHGDVAARWTSPTTTVSAPAGAQAWALRAGTTLNCVGAGSDNDEGAWDVIRPIMGTENRAENLREAIDAGVLSEAVVDRGLIRVFTQRMRLGEFDPVAGQRYPKLGKDQIESDAHKRIAQRVAEQALTLLQNRGRLLPADPVATRHVVVVGDQAGTAYLGGYSGDPRERVPLAEGLRRLLGRGAVTYDAAKSSSTATEPPELAGATREAIKTADLVVVAVGTDDKTNQEGTDRASLAMPGNYSQLIDQVAALGNPRVALVVQSAGPIDLTAARGKVAAILYSAANGQRQGDAAANVLFGRANPSDHLSFTWYRDDAQLPPMLDYDITPDGTGGLGRTYQYFTGTPLYPFGHGLSYTTFRYGRPRVNQTRLPASGTLRVSVRVTNTGRRAGATVAQLYATSPPVAGREVPRRRLVGFRRTPVLAPSRSARVTMAVPLTDRLRLWDAEHRRSFVPRGRWRFALSRSATDPVRKLSVRVHGAITRRVTVLTLDPVRPVLAVGDTEDLLGTNPMQDGLAPALPDPGAHALTAVRGDDSFAPLKNVRWRSGDPTVATVGADGRVTAVAPGVTTITARAGGATARAPIAVR